MADKDLLGQLSDMQQQQADAARWEEFLPARDDTLLDPLVREQAVAATHTLAEEASSIQAAHGILRQELAAVRDGARSSLITSQEAVTRLAAARRTSAQLDERARSLASLYATATAQAGNPAATREALLRRYPSLRG
jgi:hypothetical protein